MSEKVEVLIKNAAYLGEGPCLDEASQCLYYVDLFAGDVCRYNTVTTEISRLRVGDTTSIIIPREKGGFLVSKENEVVIMETWDSSTIRSFAKVEDKDITMLNDGKVDSSGRLWIGSCFCGKDEPDSAKWPRGCGSLYSVDPSGSVRKHKENINISNGMDWAIDNRTMYYIDSIPRQVWAFDFDIEAGTISNQRTVADFSGTEMGLPDGMTVDSEGKLWIACWDAGKVVRLDEVTGQVIRTVKFPTDRITSCCFGGKDYSDLYVTSAKFPEDSKNMTLAGSVFKVTGLGVKGRRSNKFLG